VWALSVANVLTAVGAGIAIWLSFGSLGVVDAAGGRLGLLPPLWGLALSTAATVSLFGAVPKIRHAASAVRWSLLILLPWLPLPVPDVFLMWAGPVVRLIWIAIALWMAPGLVGQIHRRRPRFLCEAHIAPRTACVLAFVASLAVHYTQQYPPVGDEPHYLLIAHSLVVDHDLKVSNNYERGDYLTYYPGRLWPHYGPPGKDGSLYSLHAPGLPALIAPALALGGYRGVVLWIAIISAVGTLFVWKAAYALTSDVTAAWVAWAAAALTAPAILQGTLIYPDSVAGTVLSAGVLAMLTASSLSIPRAAALGAGIGLLPWLHTRFAPLAAVLAVAVGFRLMAIPQGRRHRWRTLLALISPLVVSVTAWLMFFAYVYGTFDPLAAYAGQAPLQVAGVVSGVLGLIADQEFGLIPNGPVHLLWIGGTLALWNHHRRLLIELACIAVPYVLAVAAFPNWFGGSTPARYLAPMVFPLSVMVAALWCRQDDFGRSLSLALLTVSVLIACAFGFGAGGTLAYNDGQGRSAFLDWVAPIVNLPAGFPSYFRAIPAEGAVRGSVLREFVLPSGIWTIAALGIWSVSRWIHNRSALETVNRCTLAAGCLVGVISLGVVSTWQIPMVPHLVATRAQLGVIARENPAVTPLGIELVPFRVMSSAAALRRLAITTSPLDTPRAGAMLNLSEVPPGDYRLRVSLVGEPRGEISLLVGRAGGPLATWHVSAADDVYRFRLPIQASTLTIAGDTAAAESIRSVALVPVRHVTTAWAAATRARAAARYGRTVVYAIDNRVILERDGFWVLGGRQPDVVITTDNSQPELTLQISNVAIANRVRIAIGEWSASRELAPDERWLVTVPMTDSTQPAVVNIRVEQGAMMGDQFLGCRVSIVQ
jgi:hypothetical protein